MPHTCHACQGEPPIKMYIKSSRSVWTLTLNNSTKRRPNDNLCVFRASVAFQQNSKHGLESKAMELFQRYIYGEEDIEVALLEDRVINVFCVYYMLQHLEKEDNMEHLNKRTFKILPVLRWRTCQILKSFVHAPSGVFS